MLGSAPKPKIALWLSSLRKNKANLVLALLPLLLSLYLLFGRLLPLVQSLSDQKEALAQKIALIEKYREKIRESQDLKASKPGEDLSKYLFKGKDPYVVVSSLQEQLKEIEGLTIRSFRITSQRDLLERVKRVSVNFSLQGDVRTLVEMLEVLSRYEKALKVVNLTVSYYSRRKEELLQMNLQVEGLFAQEGS